MRPKTFFVMLAGLNLLLILVLGLRVDLMPRYVPGDRVEASLIHSDSARCCIVESSRIRWTWAGAPRYRWEYCLRVIDTLGQTVGFVDWSESQGPAVDCRQMSRTASGADPRAEISALPMQARLTPQ